MTSTSLISVGADEMLGLGVGADPTAAVEDFYDGLDTYGATPDHVSEVFSVSAMRLRDDLVEPVQEIIGMHAEDSMSAIDSLLRSNGTEDGWLVVDVVMEGGDRTARLRDQA